MNNMMDYEFIKSRLSPCGLHCGKCFAFFEGDIAQLSQQLENSLGNFDVYAERFISLLNEPVFSKYPDFKELLKYFSVAKCKGCRKERCVLFKSCKVRGCSEEQKVDFCFQCIDFPCNNTGLDEHLHKRSVSINQRMKEVGVEAYYNEIKDKPRY
jgi:hypothetical protein